MRVLAPVLVVPALVQAGGARMKLPLSIFQLENPQSRKSIQGLFHFPWVIDHYGHSAHLRVAEDQSSTLMINGNYILHLNPTATHMAWLYFQKKSPKEAIKELRRIYHCSIEELNRDYLEFTSTIETLLSNGFVCFHENFNVETQYPFSTIPEAPYRMDIALTYACNNQCYHCYNDPSRTPHHLTADQWIAIIHRIWDIGIPHIVFTGGEPTLVKELPELIAEAKAKGMIVGLNTNGRRLSDITYVRRLSSSGLDHIQITLESSIPSIHDKIVSSPGAWEQTTSGIRNALTENLFVMTNTTLLRENSSTLDSTLQFLSNLGVPTIGLNALIYSGKGLQVSDTLREDELSPLLEIAQHWVEQSGQKLIWYSPTHYCNFDPMALNLGIKGCTAARYNMCIEPNGDVIPCQSYYASVGNILQDKWEEIWNHPLCQSLRNRQYLNENCKICPINSECGGGCPLMPFPIQVDQSVRLNV